MGDRRDDIVLARREAKGRCFAMPIGTSRFREQLVWDDGLIVGAKK
jgi:hypothetical protein